MCDCQYPYVCILLSDPLDFYRSSTFETSLSSYAYIRLLIRFFSLIQAKGNSNLTYGTIWEDDLTQLVPYFPLFDRVYVGTMWLDNWNSENATSNTQGAAQQALIASKFLQLYPNIPNLGWYITLEGSLNSFGANPMVGLSPEVTSISLPRSPGIHPLFLTTGLAL